MVEGLVTDAAEQSSNHITAPMLIKKRELDKILLTVLRDFFTEIN